MTTAAFLLVFTSAFCHASWNFLLKRSDHKTAFLFSLGTVSFAVFLIPAVVATSIEGIGTRGLMFGVVTALLHGVYGLSLSRGYQMGDLSTVYPISRGMGPALIPLAAVIFLGERTSLTAGFGIALVVLGVYAINIEAGGLGDLVRPLRALNRPATRIALLTGALIATYSLWDKAALDDLSPLTLNQFAMAGHALILAPIALQNGGRAVRHEWRERRMSILAAGVLAPLAYVLVLAALTTSRISYVAPVREFGIVIGAMLGVMLLGEGYGRWRIAGAVTILAGVLTLALAP
ncbi:MAG: EamA family transporter [Dehalococcoidia bacterium]